MKNIFTITFALCVLMTRVFCQDYLDSDKRFMKLTEVSTDNTYGFELKNPIKVGPAETAVGAYLNSVKPLDGDKFHIADMKFNYKNKEGLTMVVLSYEQKKDLTTLYFSEKEFETPKVPFGFSFKTIDDIPKVIKFPAESILKATPCNQTPYAVDDFLLKEKLGSGLTKPTNIPTFTGGIDELKKYFTSNPLLDEKAKQMLFKVSIAFIVTCDNRAGNFQIVSKGKDDLETYANQVLAIVNKMPQNWESAKNDGKPVDCYQVLSFTISDGLLNNVSYR